MAEYTKKLRLVKPSGNEYYNIEQFNHNAELIDKKVEEMDSSLTEIKEGATREKAGIVQFGTEEGKALEGMMLARLAGCYGYGGDIQDAGIKNQNYIYYDRNTRKMYKCLNQNQDVSANVANFIPLDNNSLLERLENLFKIESYENYKTMENITYLSSRVYKIHNLAIVTITFTTKVDIPLIDFYYPITFKEGPFITMVDNNSNNTKQTIWTMEWTNRSYVRLGNVNSGTLLIVGTID